MGLLDSLRFVDERSYEARGLLDEASTLLNDGHHNMAEALRTARRACVKIEHAQAEHEREGRAA